MVEVLTGKDADAAWAKLERWLARRRWTPTEAVALLAGHYPEPTTPEFPASKFLEFVPNGRPRAWKGKPSKVVVTLASELRQSLFAHLTLLSPKKGGLKPMPPIRWLELTIRARRAPRWLSAGRMNPRLARYLPSAPAIVSLTENGPRTARASETRRSPTSHTIRPSAGRGEKDAVTPQRLLDRRSIHEWTYLDPKAVERILAAPRLKLAVPEEDGEALHLALRDITFQLLHHSFGREPTRKEVSQVRQIYDRLIDIKTLSGLDYPAPLPPEAWQASLLRWLGEEEESLASRKKGGAPIKRWDRLAYPQLLGLYELAFGRPAASTADGPTLRFVEAYLSEVTRSLAKVRLKVSSEKEQILQIWKVPNLAGLASKIRAAKPNAVARMHFDLHKAAREAGRTADIAKTDGN